MSEPNVTTPPTGLWGLWRDAFNDNPAEWYSVEPLFGNGFDAGAILGTIPLVFFEQDKAASVLRDIEKVERRNGAFRGPLRIQKLIPGGDKTP